MREESLPPWRTHDWKVRTIESIAPGGGSRLGLYLPKLRQDIQSNYH